MHGVLNIYKSPGPTSHDVVNLIRKIAGVKRVGHAGTLDPFAEGVLIVAVGNATRLLEYARNWPKTYHAEITLGAVSNTDDKTGTITPTPPSSLRSDTSPSKGEEKFSPFSPLRRGSTRRMPGEGVVVPSEEEIRDVLNTFTGPQSQIPPAYSAIKVRGRKLYEYARAGDRVERPPRPVTIHSLEILEYAYPKLKIATEVSSGTYIRALGRDIGQLLGTGAYVSHLIRKVIHRFHIDTSVTIPDISRENLSTYLQPPTLLISNLPHLTLSPKNVAKFRLGQGIALDKPKPAELTSGPVALFSKNERLAGIGFIDPASSLLRPQKVLHFPNAAN